MTCHLPAQRGRGPARRRMDGDDVDTAIRVLRAALEDDAIRERLQPAIGQFNRRQKQRQRQQQRQKQPTTNEDASASSVSAVAPVATVEGGVVQLGRIHFSRLLYPNPVCFLSTWRPGGGANLMTISWLTPIDNEGRLFCSMNERRHSAELLAAHPYFVLSVACAGLEPLLLRVGGCSGARVADKPAALGVPLCRPGWTPLSGDQIVHDSCSGSDVTDADESSAGGGWPAEAELNFAAEPPSDEAIAHALADAVAVAPCVAHVCARVCHVRPAHGHLLLTAETIAAYVRPEYWSGKTFERQVEGLPPLLSFLGSQRFGHLGSSTPAVPVPER